MNHPHPKGPILRHERVDSRLGQLDRQIHKAQTSAERERAVREWNQETIGYCGHCGFRFTRENQYYTEPARPLYLLCTKRVQCQVRYDKYVKFMRELAARWPRNG
jgi:hypothetical protein